ncbi:MULTISPECIES: hypothetical protein [unclassified Prochlorococcus]|uniref:hypothetical protein n=1 Tax=unclassified Prochlorococcus TaxID=2627481 RepID=UPI001269365F|nr:MULTISPECIES: hypothetical protein [unclassified Prochlorococcus]
MTTINTDYSNTELLDQELSFDELQEVNGAAVPLFLLGPAVYFGVKTVIAAAPVVAAAYHVIRCENSKKCRESVRK